MDLLSVCLFEFSIDIKSFVTAYAEILGYNATFKESSFVNHMKLFQDTKSILIKFLA